jgi:hypothetical protein
LFNRFLIIAVPFPGLDNGTLQIKLFCGYQIIYTIQNKKRANLWQEFEHPSRCIALGSKLRRMISGRSLNIPAQQMYSPWQ